MVRLAAQTTLTSATRHIIITSWALMTQTPPLRSASQSYRDLDQKQAAAISASARLSTRGTRKVLSAKKEATEDRMELGWEQTSQAN